MSKREVQNESRFNSYWKAPAVEYPKMSNEEITEQTGYATTEQLVELVIRSGEVLEDYRHAIYDVSHDEELESVSPFEIDPVVLNERIRARQALRAEMVAKAAAEQAKKEADIASGAALKASLEAQDTVEAPPPNSKAPSPPES